MIKVSEMTVGVLAIQGDFERHGYQLGLLGVEPTEIRLPGQLRQVDRLIIPGGESTTINIMIDRFGLRGALLEFGRQKPIFGTCAGMIMLSNQIDNNISGVRPLALLDITVDRNGYGRQVHSVDDKVVADLGHGPTELTATFIRAPRVTRVGAEVTVLATWRGDPVLVRQGLILAAAFHTELDDDTRLLEYFLSLAP